MYLKCTSLTLGLVFTATTGLATPISAISQLDMSHSFVVNGGQSPDGIDILNLSSTYTVDSTASSAIDDPAATQTDNSNFVVGNPFSDPPLPIQSERTVHTTLPGNSDSALGRYQYSIRMEDDPDDGEFDITRRAIQQTGAALVNIETDPLAASGFASHVSSRSFAFENTTDRVISFNITGQFDAMLRASYTGLDGFARTSAGFHLEFDVSEGSSVNYFPIAPYLRSIEDSAVGATVSDQLLLNEGGIFGVNFGASATAIGDGGLTEAQFEGSSRYIFGITLDPGAYLEMSTGFRQSTAVGFTPQPEMPPVPLPASATMLLFGFLTLAGLKTRLA